MTEARVGPWLYPITMRYRHELRGFAKLRARVMRKPWAWNYIADVVLDPTPRPDGAGNVSLTFTAAGPMRKEVAS